MRATYRKVKEILQDFGVTININPYGPGYILSRTIENRIYGPYQARNLKDCIKLGMEIVDRTQTTAPLPVEKGIRTT